MALSVWTNTPSTDWQSSTPVSHTNLNLIHAAIRSPGFDVTPGTLTINYNQHHLGNVGNVTSLRLTGGFVTIESALPQLTWKETDGGPNEKLWKVWAEGGNLSFVTVEDTDTTAATWMHVARAGNKADEITFDTNYGLRVYSTGASERQILMSNDGGSFFYYLGRRASDGYAILSGNQAAPNAGLAVALASVERMVLTPSKLWFAAGVLPSSNPGAGTRQVWYDPSDGNRLKYAA